MATAVVVVVAAPNQSHGADLYRLRFLPVSPLVAGEQTTATVLLDNDDYPFGGASQRVRAFSFGVKLKAPLEFAGSSLENTVISQALMGADPLFESILEVNGGITVGLVLDAAAQTWIPDGQSQALVHLSLTTPAETESTTVSVEFSGELGEPPVEVILVAEEGNVVPHTRGTTVTILGGESAQGPLGPAMQAELFPLPTAAELVTQWYGIEPTPVLAPMGGPLGEPLGPMGGGAGRCSYEVVPTSPIPGPGPGTVVVTAGPTGSAADFTGQTALQQALDAFGIPPVGSPAEYVVEVLAGTYEPFDIDVTAFGTSDLYVYYPLPPGGSPTGPEAVKIDGSLNPTNQGPGIHVIGTADPDECRVFLGWVAEESFGLQPPLGYPGWQGFEICNCDVPNDAEAAGGIYVEQAVCRVEMRGHFIHDNNRAGVVCEATPDAHIVQNEIAANVGQNDLLGAGYQSLSPGGAGIRIVPSGPSLSDVKCLVAASWIHDNFFFDTIVLATSEGGGIHATEGDVEICYNWIYGNEGIQGAGVHLDRISDSMDAVHHVEGNEIFDNVAANSDSNIDLPTTQTRGYYGAGICVVFSGSGVQSMDGAYNLKILNNSVHGNDIDATGSAAADFANDERGGGLALLETYTDVGDIFFPGPTPEIAGNYFYNNFAELDGGGVFLGAYHYGVTDQLLRFYNNTIVNNQIMSGEGEQVFLPLAANPPVGAGSDLYPHLDARNNIVFRDQAMLSEWFAECDSAFPAPAEPWVFCVLPDLSPTCATTGSWDLFGPGCLDDDPFVVVPSTPVLTDASSRCYQAGDPTVALTLPADRDGDLRFAPSPLAPIDIGADELENYRFIRGDANGDGSFSGLIDGLFLLNFGFVPGSPAPPCDDAADADDNGSVSALVDGLYILNAQFSGGPPPTAPFPSCGDDPTSDAIFCVGDASCP